MEMDFPCSAGDPRDAAIRIHWRRNRDATLELAVAALVQLASDHLLASTWTSGAVPNPLRRIRRASFRPPQLPPSHERALRAHDAGRAGTIPAADARALRLRPIHQREHGAMKKSGL